MRLFALIVQLSVSFLFEITIPNARNELSKQLATQVKKIIGWEKMPKKVDANVFLEAVYHAYQQQVDN